MIKILLFTLSLAAMMFVSEPLPSDSNSQEFFDVPRSVPKFQQPSPLPSIQNDSLTSSPIIDEDKFRLQVQSILNAKYFYLGASGVVEKRPLRPKPRPVGNGKFRHSTKAMDVTGRSARMVPTIRTTTTTTTTEAPTTTTFAPVTVLQTTTAIPTTTTTLQPLSTIVRRRDENELTELQPRIAGPQSKSAAVEHFCSKICR